ncbi:hypothetical protein LTR37_001648 [Vermiconidia calcicola]|uniref:Uncharacterized protein n=1 Tax=Vermiconidia calcicola TaxID=1690605 RepID=A0ACC3NX27_9PEZI|nr:hypothetical protein LTR37_001648 [Vermiconidia calcicola]
MEPLTITVAALGITDLAINNIIKLRNLINGLSEAKEVLQDIATSLDSISKPLNTLQVLRTSNAELSNAARKDLEKTGVANSVNQCGETCNDFAKTLEKWTKHSGNGRLSLRDRMTVGLWNKEKIRTFRARIRSCQSIVQFAVQSTQLLIQLRSEQLSEGDRSSTKQQLQVLETRIETHLDLTKQRHEE